MFRPSIGHLFSLVNLIKQRFSYLDWSLYIIAPLNLIRLRYHQQWLLVYLCRCTTNLSIYQSLSWWLTIWYTAAVVETTHKFNNISHSMIYKCGIRHMSNSSLSYCTAQSYHTHLYAKQYLINLEAETNSTQLDSTYSSVCYLAHEQDTCWLILLSCLILDHPLCSVGCTPIIWRSSYNLHQYTNDNNSLSIPGSLRIYLEVLDVNLHFLSFHFGINTAWNIQTEYLHHTQACITHKLSPQAKLSWHIGLVVFSKSRSQLFSKYRGITSQLSYESCKCHWTRSWSFINKARDISASPETKTLILLGKFIVELFLINYRSSLLKLCSQNGDLRRVSSICSTVIFLRVGVGIIHLDLWKHYHTILDATQSSWFFYSHRPIS